MGGGGDYIVAHGSIYLLLFLEKICSFLCLIKLSMSQYSGTEEDSCSEENSLWFSSHSSFGIGYDYYQSLG